MSLRRPRLRVATGWFVAPDVRAQLFALHRIAAFIGKAAHEAAVKVWFCRKRFAQIADGRAAALGIRRLLIGREGC